MWVYPLGEMVVRTSGCAKMRCALTRQHTVNKGNLRELSIAGRPVVGTASRLTMIKHTQKGGKIMVEHPAESWYPQSSSY